MEASQGAQRPRRRSGQVVREEEVSAIVARAQAGDDDAFDELFRLFGDDVFRFLRNLLRDPELAQDLRQQLFTRLIESRLAHYQPRLGATFTNWLLRVARNLAYDELRRRARHPSTHVFPDLVVDDTRRELANELTAAVAALDPKQQQIVVLHHFLGCPWDEIASDLGKSKNAVHTLHFRARHQLKERLGRAGVRPATLAA
jgi:RNA polymerase sigma-70 factor, ECF subfamily